MSEAECELKDNFTELALGVRRVELCKARTSLKNSLHVLTDKSSDYAEHHHHLINTYSEIIKILDSSMKESRSIDKAS